MATGSKGSKGKTININPANKGKLRASAGAKKGQDIPVSKLQEMAKSGDATTRKRAQFALNARKFNNG